MNDMSAALFGFIAECINAASEIIIQADTDVVGVV